MPDRRFDTATRDRLAVIQHQYQRLVRLTYAALVSFAIGFVVTVAIGSHLLHENSKATDALCTLRGDLQQRTDGAERFLREHPLGIPGVPPALLRTSIENQRRTVQALASLNCPG